MNSPDQNDASIALALLREKVGISKMEIVRQDLEYRSDFDEEVKRIQGNDLS
jgi:hypothetical protein